MKRFSKYTVLIALALYLSHGVHGLWHHFEKELPKHTHSTSCILWNLLTDFGEQPFDENEQSDCTSCQISTARGRPLIARSPIVIEELPQPSLMESSVAEVFRPTTQPCNNRSPRSPPPLADYIS